LTAAILIGDHIASDLKHPRLQPIDLPDRIQALMNSQENVLQDIIGIAVGADTRSNKLAEPIAQLAPELFRI